MGKVATKSETATAGTDDTRKKTPYLVLQSRTLLTPAVDVDALAEGASHPQEVLAWVPIGEAGGANDIEAIRKATADAGLDEGTFAAVPARSFRPRTVAAKVRRTVSIS